MISTLLIVDSKDRFVGTSEQFRYNLNKYPLNDVYRVRINKITLPYSFYAVPAQSFRVNYNAGGFVSVAIPGGNYSAVQLAVAVQTALALAVPAGTWTVSFNAITQQFTIDLSGADTFTYEADGTTPIEEINKSVLFMMGIVDAENYDVSPAPANFFTSEFGVYIGITKNIYISSSELNLYRNSIFNNNDFGIVQTIPVNADPGDMIIWQNTAINSWFGQDKLNLQYLDFKLVDDYNNVIDMRGRDWAIELEFQHSEYSN